jgi:hypothetical protein
MSEMLIPAQAAGRTRGLVLHNNSPRPAKTVALGGYLFEATLSRSWPARALMEDDGAMIVVQSAPNEFFLAGAGLTVSFFRDPDTDNKLGGIASIEEMKRAGGKWVTVNRMNGDESNQGRQLMMEAHQVRVYRVVLYAVDRASR